MNNEHGWAENSMPRTKRGKMLKSVIIATKEFTRDTCVWTRSGIDLGGDQKIYATACNKEWPYMSVPPHTCGMVVCHGCGKRIVEEFPTA